MIRIMTEQTEDVTFCNMKPVMEIRIQYPQISGRVRARTEEAFNRRYLSSAREVNRYVHTVLAAEAAREYTMLSAQAFPFSMHSFRRTLTVSAVSDRICCVVFDTYRYGGGARGNTVRSADIWRMDGTCAISALSLFPRGFNLRKAFLPHITRQFRALPPETVLPGAERALSELFSPANVALTDKGFEVFYPVCSIRPYDCGIPCFNIPYCAEELRYADGSDMREVEFFRTGSEL